MWESVILNQRTKYFTDLNVQKLLLSLSADACFGHIIFEKFLLKPTYEVGWFMIHLISPKYTTLL